MAKEIKRSSSARPLAKRRQNRSCVWWFLLGIALGVMVGNVMSNRRDSADKATDAGAAPVRDSRPAPALPSFKFQEILNDTTVEAGDKGPPPPPSAPRPQPPADQQASPVVQQPLAARPPSASPAVVEPVAPRPTEPPAPARSGTYVVQAGSFTNAGDAERRKAELAQLGISSSVQTATLPNGKTAYRVRTGAYANKQSAEQVRAQLKRNGKEGMTIPIK